MAIARASRRPILGLGTRLPRAAPSRRDFDDAVVIVIVVVIAVVVMIGSIDEEDENTLDRSRVDDRVARCRVVVDERRTIPDSRFPINQSDPRHPTTRVCFFCAQFFDQDAFFRPSYGSKLAALVQDKETKELEEDQLYWDPLAERDHAAEVGKLVFC